MLVRADLNVPLDDGTVVDDFRIISSLQTIRELLDRGARVVVCSHLGRPSGPDPAFSMKPVSQRLGELGGFTVVQAADVAGSSAREAVAAAKAVADGNGSGPVVVLENTRFEPGETENDADLARALAGLADLFVLDAFGSAHRAHASTVGVAGLLPSAAGRLLETELDALGALLTDPKRPFVVVLGGAKVSDKLAVMEHLLPRVDHMLVGGGMCFTLLVAGGAAVGASLVEDSMVDTVAGLLAGPHGHKIGLPTDIVAADAFAEDARRQVVPADAIPDGWLGLDIGPVTAGRFADVIADSGSVFWNGPMGVYEMEPFRAGTAAIANAVAAAPTSTVGGGDCVSAVRLLGLEDDIGHLSSGGGAGLELMEGKVLPGVAALERWANA